MKPALVAQKPQSEQAVTTKIPAFTAHHSRAELKAWVKRCARSVREPRTPNGSRRTTAQTRSPWC